MAQHRCLGLDATYPPAEDCQPVHHGRMTVGADERIGKGDGSPLLVSGPHHPGQVFEVDLVADAGAGRHHAEVVKGALAPAQKGITLCVPFKLPLDIRAERVGRAKAVDHHRMVDDEVNRRMRIDLSRVAAALRHRLAHSREIDDGGDTGEILHQHAGGAESDLVLGGPGLQPGAHRLDVVDRHRTAVLEADQVFEEHLERKRQALDVPEAGRIGSRRQAEIIIFLAADRDGAAGL